MASDGFVLCDIYFGRQKRGPPFLKATRKIITPGSSKDCLHGEGCCQPRGVAQSSGQGACLAFVKSQHCIAPVWRYTPVILALRRQRQEYWAFQVILSYTQLTSLTRYPAPPPFFLFFWGGGGRAIE